MTEEILNTEEDVPVTAEEPMHSETAEPEMAEAEADINCERDLSEIIKELPGIASEIKDISENKRYMELRALGLSPKEAYLATAPADIRVDSRAHLTASVPKAASAPTFTIPKEEFAMARSLFEDLDDSEIRKLYKKVTK